MAIRIVCECGFVGSVRDEYAGRRVKCTRCGLLTVATPAGTEFGGARPLAGESWDSVAPASEGAGGEEEAFWWDETAGVWRGGDEEAGALRQADWAAGPVRQSHLFNESARRGVTAKYRSGAERRAAAVGELSAGDKSLFRVSLIALLVLGAVLVVWQCVEMGPSVGPLVAGVLLLAAFAGMAILAWRWHSVGIGALFSGAIWGAFAAVAGLLYTVGRGVEPLWPSLLLGVGALTACLLCLGLLARRGVWQAMSHLGNMALIPWLVFGGVLCPLTYAGVMAVRVPTEQVVQGQTRAAKAQALKVADIKECDRRMQKIVEARAKYLETHGGVAAETLSELVAAGLLEEQETVCPAAERRLGGESAEARYEFFAYDKLSSANHHRALDETGGLIVLHRTADEHDDKGYAGHTAGGRRLQLSKQQRDEVFESREQSLPSLRCRNNLLKIYGALVQYAETHQGSLPDDLSVLVQEKLVAAETLRCPVLAAKHATGKEGSSSGRHVGGRESARAEPDKQIGLLSSSSDYWYIGSKYSLELIRKEAGGELAIVADACEPTAHRGNVYSLTARGQLRTEINSSRFTLWKQSLVGMNGAQCRENLKLLRDGLVAYAANHDGCLPVELSDLVKEGLVTEQALRCPALAAAGKVSGDTSDYFFLRDKYPLSAYVNQNAFLVSDGPEAYRVHGSFFGAVKVGSLVEDVRHTDFATFVSSTEQKLINELCKANLRRIHAALAQYAYRQIGRASCWGIV